MRSDWIRVMKEEDKEEGKIWTEWFDQPESRRLMWRLLWGVCILMVGLELLVTPRKAHFGFDGIFGFYAIIGFVGCAGMIIGTKWLGKLLKRGEDYYGEAPPEEKGGDDDD